ncbi:hypothetical protein ACLOJK_012018 [Asimina triloba]
MRQMLRSPPRKKKTLSLSLSLDRSIDMADKVTSLDPTTGFCSVTNTFHSLRPTIPLPPPTLPLSSAAYILSHLSSSPLPSFPALIDSASRHALSYHDFIDCIRSLTSFLQPLVSAAAPPEQVALILSPPTIHIPVLYFSLLSLGVVVSPSNPSSTPSEISSQIRISRPTIAFTTSAYAHKLPPSLPAILLDSPRFISMLTNRAGGGEIPSGQVSQSDTALILYSSGTTGGVKGVAITHRNIIACFAALKAIRNKITRPGPPPRVVALLPLPLFHAFGFSYCLTELGAGETTVVVMERFEVGKMVKAVEELGITCMMAAPPIVVWMAVLGSGIIDPERLTRSLKLVVCSGAPLSVEVMERFRERFPTVQLAQVIF